MTSRAATSRRSSRASAARGDDPEGDDADVDEADGDDDDADVDGPQAEVIALGGAGVEVGTDQAVLDRRDALLEPVEAQLIRQLKRQVSQHENQLLDQMRKRKRSAPVGDALGSVEEFARVIAAPLRNLGAQAFAAGVTVIDAHLEGLEFPEGAYDDYAREWVSTALRARLERAMAVDADTADRNEQINRIRATYRDWRNDRLAEAAGDLMTFAFNRGVLSAVGEGAPVRWVVDHGGLPSPDAEDNRLAGAVPAGQPFATGDVAPPSHPGCRCVLTPSP